MGKDKQDRFVREYMIDYNQTNAAIRAGYSPRTACKQASVLMDHPYVQARLAEERAKVSAKLGLTAERVLTEVARVAFANIGDVMEISSGGCILIKVDNTESLAAVSSIRPVINADGVVVSYEIRMHDKLKALDMLCRRLGLYDTKAKVVDGEGNEYGVAILPDMAVIDDEQT